MSTNRANRCGCRSCTATVTGGRSLCTCASLAIAVGYDDMSINGVQAASTVSFRQFGVAGLG